MDAAINRRISMAFRATDASTAHANLPENDWLVAGTRYGAMNSISGLFRVFQAFASHYFFPANYLSLASVNSPSSAVLAWTTTGTTGPSTGDLIL